MTEITAPRQHEKYDRLIATAKKETPLTTAVAHPCDETSRILFKNSLLSATLNSSADGCLPVLAHRGRRARGLPLDQVGSQLHGGTNAIAACRFGHVHGLVGHFDQLFF